MERPGVTVSMLQTRAALLLTFRQLLEQRSGTRGMQVGQGRGRHCERWS